MPQSIYDNGGMIGVTLDFGDTDSYVIGTTTQAATVEYLGHTGYPAAVGSYALPAGLQEGDLVIALCASDGTEAGTDFVSDLGSNGYTLIISGAVNSIGYAIGYKYMGSTPDSIFLLNNVDKTTAVVQFNAFRNATGAGSLGNIDTGISGMPSILDASPPFFSLSSIPAGSLLLAVGYLDDDLLASGSVDTDTDYLMAGNTPASSAGSTVMAAYYVPTSDITGTLSGGSFTGSGTDSWNSVLVYFANGTEQVPVFGNKKNSGIWSLTAALEAAPQYGFISATTQSADATSMPVPTGLQAGDLLIYAFAADVAASNLGSSPSIPTGFTLGNSTGSASGGVVWAYKIADGSETTISPIDNGRTTENIHAAFIFREATISSTGSAQTTTGASVIPPSISALAGEYVIILAAQDSASATATGPAGYTEIVDAAGTDANIYIGYKQVTSDGTETPGSVVFSSFNLSTENDYSATFTIGPA